jgi:hypothetical protein
MTAKKEDKASAADEKPKSAVETPKAEGESGVPDLSGAPVPVPDDATDVNWDSPEQPPLRVREHWVMPWDLFERMQNSGDLAAYCEKHGVDFAGAVRQGDIAIL